MLKFNFLFLLSLGLLLIVEKSIATESSEGTEDGSLGTESPKLDAEQAGESEVENPQSDVDQFEYIPFADERWKHEAKLLCTELDKVTGSGKLAELEKCMVEGGDTHECVKKQAESYLEIYRANKFYEDVENAWDKTRGALASYLIHFVKDGRIPEDCVEYDVLNKILYKNTGAVRMYETPVPADESQPIADVNQENRALPAGESPPTADVNRENRALPAGESPPTADVNQRNTRTG